MLYCSHKVSVQAPCEQCIAERPDYIASIAPKDREITIHIFQDGEWNGVNAKSEGRWLSHDDAFTTLAAARSYAQLLARKLRATRIICDWNGDALPIEGDDTDAVLTHGGWSRT